MGVVSAERLNDFMSNPDWTPGQRNAVQDVLDGLESSLENHLFGAWITPRPTTEVAPILASGLVAARWPVYAVRKIDGVTVDTDHPLAAPWTLENRRLRTAAVVTTFPPVLGLSTPWGSGRVAATKSTGQVTLEYEGGWGDEPAIVLAILRKARNWARNWLEDTVSFTETEAQQPPPLAEEWTKAELDSLSRYRNITAVRSRAVRP